MSPNPVQNQRMNGISGLVLCGNEVSGQSGWCFSSLNSRVRGNDVEVVLCGNEVWSVWMVFLFVEFPRARDLWIPAFAGMTLR